MDTGLPGRGASRTWLLGVLLLVAAAVIACAVIVGSDGLPGGTEIAAACGGEPEDELEAEAAFEREAEEGGYESDEGEGEADLEGEHEEPEFERGTESTGSEVSNFYAGP